MLHPDDLATVLENKIYELYDASYRMGAAEAHNNEPDYRRAQQDMYAARDAIATLAAQGSWQPLADSDYTMPLWNEETYTLRVSDGGESLEAWRDSEVYNDGTPKDVEEIGIGDFRLCQWVAAQDAPPAPPQVDDNGGRRWWRLKKDDNSQPWCIDIADMEYFWLKGWRPEYPIQAQELNVAEAPPQGELPAPDGPGNQSTSL